MLGKPVSVLKKHSNCLLRFVLVSSGTCWIHQPYTRWDNKETLSSESYTFLHGGADLLKRILSLRCPSIVSENCSISSQHCVYD